MTLPKSGWSVLLKCPTHRFLNNIGPITSTGHEVYTGVSGGRYEVERVAGATEIKESHGMKADAVR
eukprot:1143820-Pelagomonas_calceolata.AAC.3